MPRVDAFEVPGLELLFHSADHHPPHVHARKPGQWEIRVFIRSCRVGHLDVSVCWPAGGCTLRRRERAALLAGVLEHRAALLDEWERKVARDD